MGWSPVTPPDTGLGGTLSGEAGRWETCVLGAPARGPGAAWVQGEIVHRPRVRVEAQDCSGAMLARLGRGRCGAYGRTGAHPTKAPAHGGTPALPWVPLPPQAWPPGSAHTAHMVLPRLRPHDPPRPRGHYNQPQVETGLQRGVWSASRAPQERWF